ISLRREGKPRPTAAHLALNCDIDAERSRDPEQRQRAGHADRIVINLLNRIRDEVYRRKMLSVEESYGAQVLVERRRADIHRLREHVERHAAPSRVFEIDHDAPVETSELALRARIADRGDRESDARSCG